MMNKPRYNDLWRSGKIVGAIVFVTLFAFGYLLDALTY